MIRGSERWQADPSEQAKPSQSESVKRAVKEGMELL